MIATSILQYGSNWCDLNWNFLELIELLKVLPKQVWSFMGQVEFFLDENAILSKQWSSHVRMFNRRIRYRKRSGTDFRYFRIQTSWSEKIVFEHVRNTKQKEEECSTVSNCSFYFNGTIAIRDVLHLNKVDSVFLSSSSYLFPSIGCHWNTFKWIKIKREKLTDTQLKWSQSNGFPMYYVSSHESISSHTV